jgi:hypothetical protein
MELESFDSIGGAMIRKALGIILGGVLALALVLFVPGVRADERDEATQLTFNQPVEIPGNHLLAAGTYWFVVSDNDDGGKIVQIFNTDRTQLFATMETITTERPEWSQNAQLTFAKLSPNKPILLISWFYPDRTEGHRFVYSPRVENQLAAATRITVMAHNTAQIG